MKRIRTLLALTALLAASHAQAQLGLPRVQLPLPSQVGPIDTGRLREPLQAPLDIVRDVSRLRLDTVTGLLQRHRDVLEADPRGEPVVRREILAFAPSPAGLAAAASLGMAVVRETSFGAGGEQMVVLGAPASLSTAEALERLRALDPEGIYDFNHIYTGSGAPGELAQPAAGAAPAAAADAPAVGLVDSGVDASHITLRDAAIQRWGCNGEARPATHGTAVAALMVGSAQRFRGVLPRGRLYAADIYCDSPTGGSAERIAGALAWMSRERVGVVNLSLVGPHNKLLEQVVRLMVRRGHLIVAAVGNDGPAAPPLYPASYPGVVGVTAVDKRGKPLPEAARGPQVMFAAPGNNMVSADAGNDGFRQVRGTSFAAPIVAAMLATDAQRPDPQVARLALARLTARAVRPDTASVSNALGYGIVGADYRVDPARFR
ncbi:S8 family serine peptidase [Pseudoduganella sp. GCM10020061]|uniref:S8 family serine peptidase n=1 Tax=Pseudoduganella sp. GCM10020061 TaxID=3317345 RepID=UPI0036360873